MLGPAALPLCLVDTCVNLQQGIAAYQWLAQVSEKNSTATGHLLTSRDCAEEGTGGRGRRPDLAMDRDIKPCSRAADALLQEDWRLKVVTRAPFSEKWGNPLHAHGVPPCSLRITERWSSMASLHTVSLGPH